MRTQPRPHPPPGWQTVFRRVPKKSIDGAAEYGLNWLVFIGGTSLIADEVAVGAALIKAPPVTGFGRFKDSGPQRRLIQLLPSSTVAAAAERKRRTGQSIGFVGSRRSQPTRVGRAGARRHGRRGFHWYAGAVAVRSGEGRVSSQVVGAASELGGTGQQGVGRSQGAAGVVSRLHVAADADIPVAGAGIVAIAGFLLGCGRNRTQGPN